MRKLLLALVLASVPALASAQAAPAPAAPAARPALEIDPYDFPGSYPSQTYPGQYPWQQYPGQQYPGQQYPGQQYPGQQYPGQYPDQHYPGQRMLPPDRRAPHRPHHQHDGPSPYSAGGSYAPSIVIDGNALLLRRAPKKSASRNSSAVTNAPGQDQFDSWSTEKP